MRKRTIVKRLLALALAVSMVLTGLPSALVSAKEADLEEDKLKVELAKGADENPNGVFGFYITQLSGIEGKKLEIQVVRQGGTEGKASVDFKAIDIMSSYGKDYLMTVKESDSKERVLPVNPDAKPLMELYGDNLTTGDNEAGKTSEDTEDAKNDETDTASQLPAIQSVEPATSALSKLSANGEVGKQSSWRELNQKDEAYENVEKMMGTSEESSKEFLEQLEGVGCTLDFADGEYKKIVEVELIDDEEEESDEQLMFYLSSAKGAKLGENYNGYLNIRDNEISSGACFEMKESKVTLASGDDAIRVKVTRTQGVNLMSVISVGTKSDTAVAGTDYEAVKEDLVFAPGMKEKEIVVPILNTNREKDLTFYVGLDEDSAMVNNEKKVTLITLQATKKGAKVEEGTSTIGEGQVYTHTLRPNKKYSMNNGSGSATICTGLDLRLATEVKVTFSSTEGSTTYEQDCEDRTDYRRRVQFSLYSGNTAVAWSTDPTQDSFNNYVLSMPVNTKSSSVSLFGYVYKADNNVNASVTVSKVEIVYPGYTFTMNNSFQAAGFSTNGYKACNYEGSATTARTYDSNYTQLGVSMVKRTGVDTPTDQVTVYRVCDNLQFSWEYADNQTESGVKPDASNVTFEGYQLKKRNTTNTWSDTIKANKMDIMSLADMKDYIMDNNNFMVRPVFKIKEHTITFANSGTKASYSGYNNNSTLTVKALDTIKATGVPKTGYAIREVYAYSDDGHYAKNLLTDVRNPFKFIANKNYRVSIVTEDSNLRVMKDPKGSNTDKGYILYYDKDTPSNTKTSLSGMMQIMKTKMQATYRLIAITKEGYSQYHAKWRDGTVDADLNGDFSETEKEAKKDYTGFTPVNGDVLDVIMNYPMKQIYYDFYLPNASSNDSALEGRVSLRDKEIFTGKETTTGINNVTVSASSMEPVLTETSTGGKKTKQGPGYFCIEGDGMTPYDYFLVNVNALTSHGGSLVRSIVMNPDDFKTIVLNPEDDIYVNTTQWDRSKAKVFRLGKDANNKETETEISPAELVTGVQENPITYRIRVQAQSKNFSVLPTKAILRFYKSDGTEYTGKEVEKTIDPAANGWFDLDFCPYTVGLGKGTTMTLQFEDQNGRKYYEYKTGLVLKESLGILDFTNSFEFGGANTAIQLFGVIDSAFNLGWNGDFDNEMGEHLLTEEKNGVTTKTILVGLNKSILEDKKFDVSSVGKAAKDKAEAMSDYKKLQGKKDTSAEDLKKAKEKAEKAAKAADEKMEKASDPDKVSTEVTASVSLSIEFSFSMKFIADPDNDYSFYFDSMMLNAKINGGVGINVAFSTPIGVTINLGFGVEGDPEDGFGSASYVIEQRTDIDNPKKYYLSELMSDNDKINIFNSNLSGNDRAFNGYGAFGVNPKIYLSAGAGVLGNLVRVDVKGGAQFNMTFYTTAQQNTGTVTLDAGIELSVLGMKKYWPFVSKDFSLFGGNSSSIEDENYLYEPASLLTPETRVNQQSEWNPESMKAQRLDENKHGITKAELYSSMYAQSEIEMMELGTEGDYVATFIDSRGAQDEWNQKQLFYTVFDHESGTWCIPGQVEFDGTVDENVKLFNLGDQGVLITWSSASKVFTSTTSKVEMMNSMDLHAVVCQSADNDKKHTMGSIMNVSKETEMDNTYGYVCGYDTAADVNANVAYDENSKKAVIYYTKNEYEVSNQTDGETIGDVVHPSLSLMASRTIDFSQDTPRFEEEYSAADASEIKVGLAEKLNVDVSDSSVTAAYEAYCDAWYGQIFLPLTPSVYIDEELDEFGYWVDNEEPSIYSYYSVSQSGEGATGTAGITSEKTNVEGSSAGVAKTPKLIDSDAICYNSLGLFAYTADYDQDMKTVNDRDIYVQMYDFETGVYTHPIMITSDNVSDESPRLTRVTKTVDGNTGEETYLTWLSDGNIVALNLSNVIQNCLKSKKTADNQDYYIINRSRESSYQPVQVLVEGEKDETRENAESAITGYQVKQNASKLYFLWTQRESKVDDSEKQPLTETQIYMAVYDKDNMQMGAPIQLSDGEGDNYLDIDFGINSNGSMTAMTLKAPSKMVTATEFNEEIEKHNEQVAVNDAIDTVDEGEFVPYSEVDMSDITLYALRIDPKSILELSDESLTEEALSEVVAGEENIIDFTLVNNGITRIEDYTLTVSNEEGESLLYDWQTDVNELTTKVPVDSRTIIMYSGERLTIPCNMPVSESALGGTIHIVVKDANNKPVLDVTKEYSIESKLHQEDFTVTPTENRDEFMLSTTVVNDSNRDSDPDTWEVMSGNAEIASVDIPSLGRGETYPIEKLITVDADEIFTDTTDEQGFLTSKAVFSSSIDGSEIQAEVAREATGAQMEAMNAIQEIQLDDGNTIEVTEGKMHSVLANIKSSLADEEKDITGAEGLKVVYQIEDENIASIDQSGILQGNAIGTTNLKAYIMPKNSESVASVQTNEVRETGDYNTGEMVDNYTSLPAKAIRVCEATIQVKAYVPEPSVSPSPTVSTSPSASPVISASPVVSPSPKASTKPVKVGTTLKSAKMTYQVTSTKSKTVTLKKIANKKQTTVVVPNTIKIDGKKYKVTAVAKNACKGYKKLKSITFGSNIKKIEAKAYYGCTSLKKIVFKGKKAPTIGKQAFAKIAKKAVFIVPKKKYKVYKKKLTKKVGITKKMKIKKK